MAYTQLDIHCNATSFLAGLTFSQSLHSLHQYKGLFLPICRALRFRLNFMKWIFDWISLLIWSTLCFYIFTMIWSMYLNAKFRTGLNYEKPLWVWVVGLLLELAISFKAYAVFYFKIIYIWFSVILCARGKFNFSVRIDVHAKKRKYC